MKTTIEKYLAAGAILMVASFFTLVTMLLIHS